MLESHLMEQVTSVNLGLQRSVRHGAVISQSPRTSEYLHIPSFSIIACSAICHGPRKWPSRPAFVAAACTARLRCGRPLDGPSGSKSVVVGTAFGIAFFAPFHRFPFQRFLVRFAHFGSCLRACALVPMGLGEDLFPDFIGFSSHALQYSLCNSSF